MLKITEITLLTAGEAERLPDSVLRADIRWWLKTPGTAPGDVTYVTESGFVDLSGMSANMSRTGIRPVIKADNFTEYGLKPGSRFKAGGELWLLISKDTALCLRIIGESVYTAYSWSSDSKCYIREDGTRILKNEMDNYSLSTVKQRITRWAEEHNLKPCIQKEESTCQKTC